MSATGFDDLGDLAPPPSGRPKWLIPAAIIGVIVIVAVVVVVVVGGGGSSGTSLSSYITKADAICSSLNPQISQASNALKSAEQSGDTSGETSAVTTLIGLGHEEIGRIQALSQPSQDSSLIKRLYNLDTQELSDIETGFQQGSSSEVQQGISAGNQTEQLAAQIGFGSCAQVPSASG